MGHTIAAHGVCIFSTWKGGGYNTISGTSMASPHVAGTAALCIYSRNCSGGPSEIIAKLRGDAAAHTAAPSAVYYGFTDDPKLRFDAFAQDHRSELARDRRDNLRRALVASPRGVEEEDEHGRDLMA